MSTLAAKRAEHVDITDSEDDLETLSMHKAESLRNGALKEKYDTVLDYDFKA